MTATYDSPFAGAKDTIRFLISDTNMTAPLLSDEEIVWVYMQQSNVYLAAADCCDVIAGKKSQTVDKTVGKLRISVGKQVDNFLALAKQLRIKAGYSSTPVPIVAPYAGGISHADKDARQDDRDQIRGDLWHGMFDEVPDAP